MEETNTVPGAAMPEQAPQTPETKRPGFPAVGDLLAMLGIFVAAQFTASFAAILFGIVPGGSMNALTPDQMGKLLGVGSLIGDFLALIGILFYRNARGATGPAVRFSVRGFNPMLILWGFLLILAVGVVLEPLLNLLPAPPLEKFGTGLWTMAALVLIAPVFEELICRGAVLESVRSRYGVVMAWLVSALFFGIMHFQPQQSVNAFFIGLILAFLYLRTDSIWIVMILHALNNAAGYLIILMNFNPGTTLMNLIDNRTLYGMVYFAAAVLCAVSAVAVWRTLKRLDEERKNHAGA